MSCRTYRSIRYRYWCRTELTEVSGTGIDVVPNLPKCPVPVIPAVCLGTYSTEYTQLCMLFKRYPLDYQLKETWKMKTDSLLQLERRQTHLFLKLIFMRIRFRASYFGQFAKTNLVCADRNKLIVGRNLMRRWCSGHLFVCSCDYSAVQLGFWT